MLERWLEVKPYLPATLARYCDVPLMRMWRVIHGRAPIDQQAGLLLCGLLGVPFEELFELRPYIKSRRHMHGWFARSASQRQVVA